MKKHLFSLLQRIGQSFMLPIALLPIAGIFLGIGSSLTNTNMLAAYHLKGLMGPGTAPYILFSLLNLSLIHIFILLIGFTECCIFVPIWPLTF